MYLYASEQWLLHHDTAFMKKMVEKNRITAAEYKEITGSDYSA